MTLLSPLKRQGRARPSENPDLLKFVAVGLVTDMSNVHAKLPLSEKFRQIIQLLYPIAYRLQHPRPFILVTTAATSEADSLREQPTLRTRHRIKSSRMAQQDEPAGPVPDNAPERELSPAASNTHNRHDCRFAVSNALPHCMSSA